MLLNSSPTTLAVKKYKVVLPYSQSDKVSAFHAQFYHRDVGICMFIMWGLWELRNRQPSQTKHAKCLQPLSSVWQGVSISCSVLSLRRWYLYVHHVWASAHCNINKPLQTRHAKCLQPLPSVWQGVSISYSVLSLRRWYFYVHHVWASAHCNINKPSQTRHAKCLQPLSSVWQGVSISCSVLSLRRWYLYVHHVRALRTTKQATLSNKTCQVLAQPSRQSEKVSAFHAQFYHWDVGICMFIMWGLWELRNRQPSQTKHAKCLQPLSSVWQGVSISCSVLSLRRWYLYVHHLWASVNCKASNAVKRRQVVLAPIVNLARCQHFLLSSSIETVELEC